VVLAILAKKRDGANRSNCQKGEPSNLQKELMQHPAEREGGGLNSAKDRRTGARAAYLLHGQPQPDPDFFRHPRRDHFVDFSSGPAYNVCG